MSNTMSVILRSVMQHLIPRLIRALSLSEHSIDFFNALNATVDLCSAAVAAGGVASRVKTLSGAPSKITSSAVLVVI